ncbi:MAG: hypothetical protein V9G13_05550 [Marmoricola sp.]
MGLSYPRVHLGNRVVQCHWLGRALFAYAAPAIYFAATYAWWLFGMISFEKSIVILLVLPMIAFAYFTIGRS